MADKDIPAPPRLLPFPAARPQVFRAEAEIGGVPFTAVMEVWATEHAHLSEHPTAPSPNSGGGRRFSWYFVTNSGEIVYPRASGSHSAPGSSSRRG